MPEDKEQIKAEAGVLQWFHVGQHELVENSISDLKALGIRHLRTGFSWTDYLCEGGEEWYEWLMPKLAKEFELLPCFHYMPPPLGVEPKISSPPKNTQDYANFVYEMLQKFGHLFEYVELWNEPNNLSEYDWRLDPHWYTFCDMVGRAANTARNHGKKTVLGGMAPVDPAWLEHIFNNGLMPYIDVIGIHGFPDVFDYGFPGWETNIGRVQAVMKKFDYQGKIWVTEAGYSTWQHDEKRQVEEFMKLQQAPVERFYWYTCYDLNPKLATVDGLYLDPREYHFGMKSYDGTPKMLYRLLEKNKLNGLQELDWLTRPVQGPLPNQATLITGGAGFIGSNLADRLLQEGEEVIIIDNLSRNGSEDNLEWLRKKHGRDLPVMINDIRNEYAVEEVVQKSSSVFHLAGQVAVPNSLRNPKEDFQVNSGGTVNILEALRHSDSSPFIVFASTNKVYGAIDDVVLTETDQQYFPADLPLASWGIDEQRQLDFTSPYGCSKGTADQYVLDYSRVLNVPGTVLRMSCVYGPHQHGTQAQGWIAHFLRQALLRQPVTIFGTGKQVRDVLYVTDVVEALLKAREFREQTSGQAFNLGGGPPRAVSLLEVAEKIEQALGEPLKREFEDWRPGDQRYFVADTRKFQARAGWQPEVAVDEGMKLLLQWLVEHIPAAARKSVYR